jgi:hypothetical protein
MIYENPKYSTNRSFIDFMFILVCALTLFFVVTLMQILKNNEGVVHKAEFVLTLTWDKEDKNDMDLWLKDPQGNIIYYKDKTSSAMFLDRDDLGHQNDTIIINGVEKIIYINQEIISIRAIVPGKWTVAVHFYKRHDKSPGGTIIPVIVRMDKMNPKIQIIFNEEIKMRWTWQEVTVTTFEVLPDGMVTNMRFGVEEPMVHERIAVPVWGPDIDGDGDAERTDGSDYGYGDDDFGSGPGITSEDNRNDGVMEGP